MSKNFVSEFNHPRLMPSLFSRIACQARRGLGLAVGFLILLAAGPAVAMTECSVVLQSAYVGDTLGTGNYAVFLVYSYTASNGSTYTGQGSMLLSNPAAAAVTAVVIEANATQQTALTIRYENSSGASKDTVCEASSARTDLIGLWLP